MLRKVSLFLFILVTSSFAFAADAPQAQHPKVYFKNLTDGQIVASPFKVEMGSSGIEVAPAGELKPGTGHHHIIIDALPIPSGAIVPADAKHIHFGKAQTEAELNLPPGKYKLTLQFADGIHRSYGPELSSTISIEVQG